MQIALNCGANVMVALRSGFRYKNKKGKWGRRAESAVKIM